MSTNGSAWIIAVAAAAVSILFGVIWFFVFLVILNGFSGREAEPMILTSVILSLINVVASAGLSSWLAGLLQRKAQVSAWVMGPMAIIAVTVTGIGIVIVGSWIGVAVFSNR